MRNTDHDHIAEKVLAEIPLTPTEALKFLLPAFVELYETFDPDGEIAVWGQWREVVTETIDNATNEPSEEPLRDCLRSLIEAKEAAENDECYALNEGRDRSINCVT